MSHSLTSEPSRSESAAAAAMPPQPRPYRNDPYAQLPNAAAVLVCHDDDNDAAAAAAFATGGGIDDEDKNNSNNRSNYGDDGVASAQLHEASARDVRVGDTIAYECMTPHREWRVALGTVLALPAAHVLHVRRYDAVNATSLPRDPATETALRATAEQRGCLDVWHDRQALAEELTRVAAQEHATASQLFAARLQTRQKRDDAEAHMAASLEALDVARTNLHTVPQRQWREARTRSDVASDVQRLLQAVLLVLREDACTTSLADMQTVLRQPDFMQRLLACDCSERPLSLERRRRIVQLCEPELPPTPAAAAAAAAAASSSSTSNKRKSTTTAASSSKATSVKKTKAAGAAGAGAAAAAKRKTTSTAAQQRRRRSSASSSAGGSGSGAAAGALRVPEAGEAVGTMTALDAALRRWVNAQFACAHATMQRERAMHECFAELQEQRVQLSAINDVRIHMSRLQEQMRELRLTIEHGDAGTEAIAAAITEQPAAAAAGEQQPAGAVTTTTRCATTVVVAGQIVAMRDGGEPPVAPLECLPVDTTFYRAAASEAFCLRQQLLVNFGVVVCDAAGYVHLTPTQVVALRNVSYQANVRHDAKEMAQLLEQKAREEAELKDLHELLSELSARHTPLPHDEDEKAQLRQLIDDAEQRHEATLTRIADLYAAGRGAREITLASQRAAHTFTRLHFKMSGDWEALTSEPGRLAALKQALYADIMRILHIPLENISDLELRKGSLEAYFTVRHNGELDDKELQELINQDTFANLCAFYESVTFKKTYPLNTEAQQAAYDYMCRMEERKGHLPVSGMGVAQYVSDYYGPGKAAAASSSSGDDEDAGEVVDMSEFYSAEVRGDAEYCATRVRVAAVREDYDDVLVNLKDEYAIVFEELPRMPEEEEEEEEEEAAVAAALDEAVAAPVLQQQEQELEEEEAVAAAYADHVRKGHDDDSEAAIARTQDSLVRTGAEQGVQTQLGLTQMELTDDGHMHTMTTTTAGNAAADQFAVELSTPPREAASKPLSPAEEHAKQHVEAAAEESATAMMQQQEHEHAGHDVRPPTPPQPSSAHHESPRELSPHEAAAAIAAAAPASAHSSHHTTPRAATAATPKQATPRAAATPRQQSASRSTPPREATSKPLSPAEEHAKQHVEAAAEENATAMMQQQEHEHAGHDVRPPTPPQPSSAHHESPRELSPHEAAAAIAAAAPASAHSSHHTTPRAAATPKQATPRAAATPSNASVSSEAVVQQVCEEQAQHAAADAHAHGNATVEAQTQAATAAAFATVPDVDKDASEQREL